VDELDVLKPTGRPKLNVGSPAVAVAIGAAMMLGLASQTGNVWLQVVGCGLIGLLLVSLVSVVVHRDTTVAQIDLATDVRVGESVRVTVTLGNRGTRPSRPLVLRYSLAARDPLLPDVVFYIESVQPGDEVVVAAERVATIRGHAPSGVMIAKIVGCFGLLSLSTTTQVPQELFVAPRAADPVPLPIPSGAETVSSGPVGHGLDVRGVRDWRPGDSTRHVHWRSTARTGRLTVLEYGEPAIGSIGVVVVGDDSDDHFEAMLAAGAATAAAAIADGVEVVALIRHDRGQSVIRLSAELCHRPFTMTKAPYLPDEVGIAGLLRHVGQGGVLLLAPCAHTSASWRAAVEAAARAADVVVVDLAAASADRDGTFAAVGTR
jgi:uncharacterized protein (DUF58 family)